MMKLCITKKISLSIYRYITYSLGKEYIKDNYILYSLSWSKKEGKSLNNKFLIVNVLY
jgi:hypothetical protein